MFTNSRDWFPLFWFATAPTISCTGIPSKFLISIEKKLVLLTNELSGCKRLHRNPYQFWPIFKKTARWADVPFNVNFCCRPEGIDPIKSYRYTVQSPRYQLVYLGFSNWIVDRSSGRDLLPKLRRPRRPSSNSAWRDDDLSSKIWYAQMYFNLYILSWLKLNTLYQSEFPSFLINYNP